MIHAIGAQQTHIPYRNSKLTFVLQDVLRPHRGKVLLIVTVTPLQAMLQETVSSLSFGTRCRSVNLGTAKRNIALQDLEGEEEA